MKNNQRDLLVIAVFTIVAMLITTFGGKISLLRLLFAFPLVFILPGAAILDAVAPRYRLGSLERWAISIGISLGIAILGGFLLNLMPQGLQASTWALLLGLVTLGAVGVSFLKHREMPAEVPAAGSKPPAPAVILMVLSAILVIGAVGLARASTTSLSSNFTQLWMTPAGSSQPNVLDVGITNMEATTVNYWLVVNRGGQQIQLWSSIQLKPGQTWSSSINLATAKVQSGLVVASLFRLDKPAQVYRMVTWQGSH